MKMMPLSLGGQNRRGIGMLTRNTFQKKQVNCVTVKTNRICILTASRKSGEKISYRLKTFAATQGNANGLAGAKIHRLYKPMKKAIALLSPDSIRYRVYDLPAMPENDLRQAMDWQIRNDATLSKGEAFYDIYHLGIKNQGKSEQCRVVAVIAEVDAVKKCQKMAAEHGLVVEEIDDESGVIARHQASLLREPTGLCSLINIDQQKTTIMLMLSGKLLDVRQVNRGIDWIETQLADQKCIQISISKHIEGEGNSPIEFDTQNANIYKIWVREILQSLRTAIHHCSDHIPVTSHTIASSGLYVTQKHRRDIQAAWLNHSDIALMDLGQSIQDDDTIMSHGSPGNSPDNDRWTSSIPKAKEVMRLQTKKAA